MQECSKSTLYSQLLPCKHPTFVDTPILRSGAKSPAKTTKKCMEITPVITDSHYYEIADTSCGPNLTVFIIVLLLLQWTS